MRVVLLNRGALGQAAKQWRSNSTRPHWPGQGQRTSGDGLRDVGDVVLGDEHRVNHVHLRIGATGWAEGLLGWGRDEHAAQHSLQHHAVQLDSILFWKSRAHLAVAHVPEVLHNVGGVVGAHDLDLAQGGKQVRTQPRNHTTTTSKHKSMWAGTASGRS